MALRVATKSRARSHGHDCADHSHGHVNAAATALSEAKGVDTEDAAAKLAKTTNKFLARWLEALDRYYGVVEDIASGIDPETGAKFSDIAAATGPARSKAAAQLVVDWHATIETGFVEAHTLGVKEWGAQAAKQPSTGALRAQIAREKRFAFNFAMDVARGHTNMPGRMNAGLRSAMYGSSLAGCYQRGTIDGSPDGMLIHWRLGIPKTKSCVWTPGARVHCRRGDVPICDVVVGDEVLTHNGRWRRVTAVHATPMGRVDGSSRAFTVTSKAGTVGLTADHKVMSYNGWLPVESVRSVGAVVVQLPHVEAMSTVLGADTIAGPYDLPEVSTDVRVRRAEVAQGREVHEVHRAGEVGEQPAEVRQYDGRQRAQAPAATGGAPAQSPHSQGGPATPPLQAGQSTRWSVLRDLLRCRSGGSQPVPFAMDVGAGERPDTRRDGDSPRQRGPDRRSVGELRNEDGLGPQAGSQDAAGRFGHPHADHVHNVSSGVPRTRAPYQQNTREVLQQGVPQRMAEDQARRPEGDCGVQGVREGDDAGAVARSPTGDVFQGVPRGIDDCAGRREDVPGLRPPVHGAQLDGEQEEGVLDGVRISVDVDGCRRADLESMRVVLSGVRSTSIVSQASDVLAYLRRCMEGDEGVEIAEAGRLDGAHIVYDLTVEDDHSYIAEGVIVSNCAACPVIAASSPFTRETLPTVPRACQTPCIYTPESRVKTRRGDVPIRDVVAGDEVLTHALRWRRVTATHVTPANGHVGHMLRDSIIGAGVGLTSEHEVLTFDGWYPVAKVAPHPSRVLTDADMEVIQLVVPLSNLGPAHAPLNTPREAMGGVELAPWAGGLRGGEPRRTCDDGTPLALGTPLYDLTVEEDESFIVEGFIVANCMSLCLCSLEYKAIDLSPPTEEEVAVGAMGNIPVADRAAGVMPTPPPGRRLPNDRERAILQDLEQRRHFAERRAQEFHEAGDEVGRDIWLDTMRSCTSRTIDITSQKDADGKRIFWVKSWSAKAVLRGDDIRAPDVSFLTHIKAIDGTTVSRVQVEARRQAAEAARKDAAALIAGLPAETSPTVPNFRDLVKLAGAPAGIFDAAPAHRDDGIDWLVDTSASGAYARTRVDELVTDVTPDASAEVTVTAIGMGGAATLRLGSVMLAALGAKADAYANVRVGPMGDDWPALALTAGMWVQGPSKSVDAFMADVRRKFKGRGIATSYWQA